MSKFFEKVILEIVKRHIIERTLLNASQFGFRARHINTLQCMRIADHVTPHFNNNMSTASILSDIEKPLKLHGNLACSTSYRNYNFRPV
jgi:hypothetical protein